MLGSDKRKRRTGCAVSGSVDGVYQPFASTPLLVGHNEYLLGTWRTRKEAQIFKIKIVGSRDSVKVENIHSGSFSAWTAQS